MVNKCSMKNRLFYAITAIFLAFALPEQILAKEVELSSPDGKLKISVQTNGQISYTVTCRDQVLLENCQIQLQTKQTKFGVNPVIKNIKQGSINETLTREIPIKNKFVKNNCNTLLLSFKDGYTVEFRAFNDGIAYRFSTSQKGENEIIDERLVLNFPANYHAHVQQTNSFKTSYEHRYTHLKTADYKKEDDMVVLPVLLEAVNGTKILISEADLHDYPCMFLKSTGNNGLESIFPKNPLEFGEDGDRSQKILKEADYIAKTTGTRTFPWRFFVIAQDDRQILENEFVYKLSTPNVLTDISWIKPGKVTWEWWHDACLYGVDFQSGYNMDSYKYYIDFASKQGIPYIIMDEGWAKSTRDPYTPNPTIDLPGLIQYAKDKNVKIVLWLTWLAVENNFDLFKTFSDWGIAGVKIDFMDRSDQWMVNYYERVAAEAAKHKIFVDFHGSFKPAGLERTYPNVLSYEGVLGLEQGGNCKPENSIWLPFMRNAVGPMDFTPGAMLNAQPENNRGTRTNPMGTGTRANMMSQFIVFESGLVMLADNPYYYNQDSDCANFIAGTPVVWDETRVLSAKAGDHVVIAKRSGDTWYVGGMVGTESRTIDTLFDFLEPGTTYQLVSFEDGVNAARQAMDYKKKVTDVNNKSKLSLKMVRNGGWAGVITKK